MKEQYYVVRGVVVGHTNVAAVVAYPNGVTIVGDFDVVEKLVIWDQLDHVVLVYSLDKIQLPSHFDLA